MKTEERFQGSPQAPNSSDQNTGGHAEHWPGTEAAETGTMVMESA